MLYLVVPKLTTTQAWPKALEIKKIHQYKTCDMTKCTEHYPKICIRNPMSVIQMAIAVK